MQNKIQNLKSWLKFSNSNFVDEISFMRLRSAGETEGKGNLVCLIE